MLCLHTAQKEEFALPTLFVVFILLAACVILKLNTVTKSFIKMSKEQQNSEKELSDLLDSALGDFKDNNDEKVQDSVGNELPVPEGWDENVFKNQVKLLEDKVNDIFVETDETQISGEQITLGLEKMAEAAAMALQGDMSQRQCNKYAENISEALKELKDGVTNLQAPISEADIANMFSNLNVEEDDSKSKDNPFLPLIQGMMQSLLSAEILLPSIRELLEKYPKYLKENENKISAEDKERYIKQQKLFMNICHDLEAERLDDSASEKQERFKRVLDNMQKLHEYGQPPDDLIGAEGSTLFPPLDVASSTGENNNQCPLM